MEQNAAGDLAELQRLQEENVSLKGERAQLESLAAETTAAASEIDLEIEQAKHELSEWRRATVLSDRVQGCLLGMLAGDAAAGGSDGGSLPLQLVKVMLRSVLAANGHTFLPNFVQDTRTLLKDSIPAVRNGEKQPEEWLRGNFGKSGQQTSSEHPPAAVLLLVVPILLGGIAVVGANDERRGGHARAVHYAVELVASVIGNAAQDQDDDDEDVGAGIGTVGEAVATWCEILWSPLQALLHGSAPSATIFRQAMPPASLTRPDACERLLQTVGSFAPQFSALPFISSDDEGELNANALFDDPWASTAWYTAVQCGELEPNDAQRALVGAMLGAAGGVTVVPESELGSIAKGDRDLVEAFAAAVAPLPLGSVAPGASNSHTSERAPTLKEMGKGGRFGSLSSTVTSPR